jgi:hypothetical protein
MFRRRLIDRCFGVGSPMTIDVMIVHGRQPSSTLGAGRRLADLDAFWDYDADEEE